METLNQTISLSWATNINHKLDCDGFVHVDRIGDPKPSHSQLVGRHVEFVTRDGSHPPVIKELYDVMTFRVRELTDCVALASHGMTASQLKESFLSIPGYSEESIICLYYYGPPARG